MNEVIDGHQRWPITNSKITTQHIKVTMAGAHGYQAVTGGDERHGQVDIGGNVYNINLPGLQAGGMEVEFKRI